MGKVKKNRRRSKGLSATPYSRDGSLEERVEMMDTADDDGEEPAARVTDRTRGQTLQRHKLEWKSLRKDLDMMKRERVKLSKKNLDEKGARKDMTRQLKSMQQAMEDRHKREIAAWDHPQAAAEKATEVEAVEQEVMEEEI
eukprot:TRINITY_DN5864_c0_g1_i1.p1 TRINITY_DN5864_c0_g1~~TRINITY_DN5864_c0_g1_i1.p1  ORF type:complete len:141 (+),score=38.59 TRINITY_DN5864_c0_g1_i1:179-601(+)